MRAGFVLSGMQSGIRRNASMFAALQLSIAIALAFVGAAILARTEITRFKETYESKINVSVYLCALTAGAPCHGRTSAADQQAIERKLTADPIIESFKFLNEQEVYERQKPFIDPTIIKTGVFRVGVLPATFIVHLKDVKNDFDKFEKNYVGLAGVASVTNQSEAFKTLLDIIDSVLKLSILIAFVVLVASVLLIANTVQVAAAQRREETSIMRLVGASRWMTELPFILETVLAAVNGGVLAWLAIWVGKQYVLDDIFGAQARRGVIPKLDAGDIALAGVTGLVVGIVLCVVTAFATLRLRVKL